MISGRVAASHGSESSLWTILNERRRWELRTTASVAKENVNFDPVPVDSGWGRVAVSDGTLATVMDVLV